MYRALILATSLVPFVAGSADAQCHCGTSTGSSYTYSAPATGTVVAPPAAPLAGATTQYRSVQPMRMMPPAAPTGGYTYRSYSVQPRYSMSRPYSTSRPQDDLIMRKQHPGTYQFR